MRYKALHYLSLAYSISMGAISSYFFTNSLRANGWKLGTIVECIVALGMIAQLLYTLLSRQVLTAERYEVIETLDNDMMFSEEDAPKIKENNGFVLLCALLGGVVSTAVLIFSALIFKEIFELNLNTPDRILSTIFITIGLTLSVPAVIYNFRTYKLSGLR
jgi:tellurite resistance protein TehA-like permease